MFSVTNEAVLAYREKYCVGEFINTSKMIYLHQHGNRPCSAGVDPRFCPHLASIVSEGYPFDGAVRS